MEVTLLDTNLNKVGTLDLFNSLIWTDRYDSFGDFEIFTDATIPNIAKLQEDLFLQMDESEHTMTIESIELKTDIEKGNQFIVTGRSLESILDRRIIWRQTVLSGSLQEGIRTLLNENAIAPTDADRRISRLIFEYSTDPLVTGLSVDTQFNGDNLYWAIESLCKTSDIGFKITTNAIGQFVFKLYAGVNRSYDQLTNPFVAFSPDLDNLSNTNYKHSKVPYKTVTLVGGEGEGSDRVDAIVMLPGGGATDLQRREKFTDASDVSSIVDGITISDAQYYTLLVNRGLISLVQSQPDSSFDGKVDYSTTYVYGVDFFLGDVVQVANEFGLGSKSRVTELVFSENISGRDIYPTFKMMD